MSATHLIGQPVFLALTTTEPNGEGRLVRVRAQRDRDAKTLERLIHVERLTASQARLTGISNAQLTRALDADEALQELIEFSAGAESCIVANGAATRLALRSAAQTVGFPRLPLPPALGVDELAAIVLPTVSRRGLSDIEDHYRSTGEGEGSGTQESAIQSNGITAPQCGTRSRSGTKKSAIQSNACFETEAIRRLWLRLEEDLLKLPLPLLAEMNGLINKTDHPLRQLLKKAEIQAVKNQFADTFGRGKLSLEKLFKNFSTIIERLVLEESGHVEASVIAPLESITTEEIARLVGPGGPLAVNLPSYEERPEQLEMAQRVGQALTDGKHLLVEAGTGVGKSLAYLVPAVLFAQRAARPVMLSTYTKNLQSQLFFKDLPFLRQHLGVEFTAALLKGRSNYLCLRKFLYTLQESARELDDEDRAQLLPIMTWAVQTNSGDVVEMAAFSPEENYDLWDCLHTIGEDCLKRQCPFYQRCFLYKARGAARAADVVVLNHALVFAELNCEAGTLPPFNEIVFDEAHKLEDVATEHLACEVTPRAIFRILNRLFRAASGNSAGKGLLPALLSCLDQAQNEFTPSLMSSIRDHILTALQAVPPANNDTDLFFDIMRGWTDRITTISEDDTSVGLVSLKRGRSGMTFEPGTRSDVVPSYQSFNRRKSGSPSGNDRKRFSAKTLRPDDVENFRHGKEAIISSLGRLRQALEKLEDDFKEIRKRAAPHSRELAKDISAQNLFLAELINNIEFVVKGEEPNYVYWSERLGQRGARIAAAPLDVSALLHDQLYDKKRSIIFTSATLSVRDVDAGAAAGLAPLAKRSLNVPPDFRSHAKKEISDSGIEHDARTTSIKPHPKSFEFLKTRLGLSLCASDKLDELLLGSPFDYQSQCRLYVPTFLPEPNARLERDFSEALTALLAELILVSRGRTMALYTSYSALTAGARMLRNVLSPEGIEVLAQGIDGSRESLLARLKADRNTVLLGTASFWEGVDVQGEALSLLVIAKLPFAVFTDPIIQGRCELLEAAGKDPFLHFSVPNAILRLRQGFGRLIRSKTDKGVVVLADKRVLTKKYGAAFLRALPATAETMTSQDGLVRAVREFL
ncbi:MAG: helicase C-terminal domain-containing protein [Planctomycetota bacterium]